MLGSTQPARKNGTKEPYDQVGRRIYFVFSWKTQLVKTHAQTPQAAHMADPAGTTHGW